MIKFLKKLQHTNNVRRFNFIVGTRLLYQGVFIQHGLLGFIWIQYDIKNKRNELAYKYRIPVKSIKISNTIKD